MFDYIISDYAWDNFQVYRNSYYALKPILKSILGERGNTNVSLSQCVSKKKGTIIDDWVSWVNDENFKEDSKRLLAGSVPHIFLYPESGVIVPDSIVKINFR